MRRGLLDLMKCPNCSQCDLSLYEHLTNEVEIRSGQVVCNGCEKIYKIEKGILDMRIENTKLGWETFQEGVIDGADDDWLLNSELGYRNAPDSHAGHYSFGIMLNFDKAVSEMNLTGDETLLDLAAGTTWLTNSLAQRGIRCIALDLVSQKYIGLESADVFMSHHGTYYERILADMNNLPFADSVFDIILSHSAIHHSPDLVEALAQIHSILKPGGCLFLVNEPTSSIGKLFDAPLSEEEMLRGENPHSFLQYTRAIKRAGFRRITTYYPPSLSRRLDALATGTPLNQPKGIGQTIKYRIVATFLPLWKKSPLIRSLTERYLFWPYLFIVGHFTIIGAQKGSSAMCTER